MDKTKIAVELFDEFAEKYQEKFMDFSLYNDCFDLFCSWVKPSPAKIIDLACGPGNITRYLLRKRPDFRILGTDLSENMLHLAKENNPQAEFQLLDLRKTHTLKKKFDGVMCGFGLPYLEKTDALKLIADVAELLSPGGIFFLSTMEDDYEKSSFKGSSSGGSRQMYLHYHEAGYLTEAMGNNGLEILHLERKFYPETESWDLIIIANKKAEAGVN